MDRCFKEGTNNIMENMKKGVFINFSNHPSELWEEKQRLEAEKYGQIKDYSFPEVSAQANEEDIKALGDIITKQIITQSPSAVLCQGEFSLAFYVVCRLKSAGIRVLAACSERKSYMLGNEKRSVFSFCRFREYV